MPPNRSLLLHVLFQGITWESSSSGSGDGFDNSFTISMGTTFGFGIIE